MPTPADAVVVDPAAPVPADATHAVEQPCRLRSLLISCR